MLAQLKTCKFYFIVIPGFGNMLKKSDEGDFVSANEGHMVIANKNSHN